MFSGRPSVRDSRGSSMFPRYLQYLLTDFRQTFVTAASWDTDDLITFLGQNVKVQGHTIAQHSTLPSSATFSSMSYISSVFRKHIESSNLCQGCMCFIPCCLLESWLADLNLCDFNH